MLIPIHESEFSGEVAFYLEATVEHLSKYTISLIYAGAIAYAADHNELGMAYLTPSGQIEANFTLPDEE